MPVTPDDFPYRIEIPARFADLDVNMHLNNSAAGTFYEDCRTKFHLKEMRHWLRHPETPSRLLIGRTTIEYWAEGPYPATYTVGCGVTKIGRSSWVDALALFVGGAMIGACETTMVHTYGAGSAPMPDDLLAVLETLRAPTALRFG